jgi:hypothetical protein
VAYLGNTLQVAFPSYRNIDDISGSFNGVTTTFALRVSGAAPVPFPISSNQCLISVGGVVQRPDDSGTEGFRISGTNIIFSSAPSSGADFFGVILAGADYVNVGANFPSGSVTVPSITFDNDLDTGIYNPNANEIGFTTGGTARLIIDANGQVRTGGLGTAGNPVYTFNSDPNTGIYSPGADQLAISTNGTGRLFVNSAGNVGIGTSTAPSANGLGLAIYDASFPRLTFRNSTTGDGTGDGTQLVQDGLNFNFANTESGSIKFFTANTERAVIDSSGRLGLGTSSPGQAFSVVAPSTAQAIGIWNRASDNSYGGIYFKTNDGATDQSFILNSKIGTNGAQLSFYTKPDGGSTAERLTIDSSGRVGIGTTSPDYLLTVGGGSGVSSTPTAIRLDNTYSGSPASKDKLKFYLYKDANESYGLTVGDAGDTQYWAGGASNGIHRWFTSGTERVRIDSSGRLLVGTSTSRGNNFSATNQDMRFQVEGTDYLTSGASFTSNTNASDQGPHIVLNRSRGSTIGSNTIVQDNDNLGYIFFEGNDGAQFVRAASIEARVDGTPGANDMPGRLVFSTTADGASIPTERIHIKSNTEVQWRNVTELFPFTDNSCLLGKSGYRWSAVWAANGTIQTSDQRAKTAINDSQLGSEFIKTLRPVSYKWVEGGQHHTGEYDKNGDCIYETLPGTRTHWGFIAQEVKEAVDAAGVDFGGWVLTNKDDPDSQQALRYDQFIAPITKALQEALTKIETLEAKVAALETA